MTIVLSGSEWGTVLIISRSSCHYGQFCSYCTLDTAEMAMTVSNLAFRLTTTFCDLQVVCFGAFKRLFSVTILGSIIRIYNMAIHPVSDSAIEKKIMLSSQNLLFLCLFSSLSAHLPLFFFLYQSFYLSMENILVKPPRKFKFMQ